MCFGDMIMNSSSFIITKPILLSRSFPTSEDAQRATAWCRGFSADCLASVPDGQCSMAYLRPKTPSFDRATFEWASCIIDAFFTLVQHWTWVSSLSYNQAYVSGPRFWSISRLANQAHIALSDLMTSKDQQRSSFGSGPTFPDLPLP